MHVTMVKKRSVKGEPCPKCTQAEEMLRSRGLWEQIHEVIWADAADDNGPGMLLAKQHQVSLAPFFIVEAPGAPPEVLTSALRLARLLSGNAAQPSAGSSAEAAHQAADKDQPRAQLNLATLPAFQ